MDSVSYNRYPLCKYYSARLNIPNWYTVVKSHDNIILVFVFNRVRAIHSVFMQKISLGILDKLKHRVN